MQIRIFSIPIPGGEKFNEELNTFLRSKKIVQIEDHLVQSDKATSLLAFIYHADTKILRENVFLGDKVRKGLDS